MDTFYFNKIAGAVLASLLVLVGVNTAIQLFYPKGTADLSKGRIVVAPEAAAPEPTTTTAAKPEEKEPPVESVLASANADAGKNAAKACGTCHNWTKGAGAKIGPDLYGVVGREIGKEPGFSYSNALQGKGGKWTAQSLYEWLKDPKAFIPGNKMTFPGIKSPQERANIIAFLDKQSDNPVPLAQR
jgi:cytochrome c